MSQTREEAIKTLLEPENLSALAEKIETVNAKLDLILSVIVVQQKDACAAVGITDDTVRNKVLRGETTILQRDGSRLNYLTLGEVGELKPRRPSKAKKRK